MVNMSETGYFLSFFLLLERYLFDSFTQVLMTLPVFPLTQLPTITNWTTPLHTLNSDFKPCFLQYEYVWALLYWLAIASILQYTRGFAWIPYTKQCLQSTIFFLSHTLYIWVYSSLFRILSLQLYFASYL